MGFAFRRIRPNDFVGHSRSFLFIFHSFRESATLAVFLVFDCFVVNFHRLSDRREQNSAQTIARLLRHQTTAKTSELDDS